jgi:hypothetical protein
MFKQLISQTQDCDTKAMVRVKIADLDSPRSADEMEAVLVDHAISCHECLAAVLFCVETLDRTGCSHYRTLLASFKSDLAMQASPDEHLTEDVIEEYCFGRLSEEQATRLEQHAQNCSECGEQIKAQREFIRCIKIALLGRRNPPEKDVNGVLRVRAGGVSLCSLLSA